MRSQEDSSKNKLAEGSESKSDQIAEFFTEDELEEFLVHNGVFEQILLQLPQTPPSPDWEAELDEL